MILAFIGTTELLLIAALALLLFGGKKLPELMRGLGKGVREFKEGVKEVSNITKIQPKQNKLIKKNSGSERRLTIFWRTP